VGGEEFAILLPDTPFDGAMKLANDMRLAFERLDLKKKSTGESLGKITLSLAWLNTKLMKPLKIL
jgi:diguanylate cyclase